jgi:hypothetical protein
VPEFPLREIAVVEQIQDKQFGRIGEEPADHMTHGVPAGPLAVDNSAIDKGSTFTGLDMPDVAFLLENAKRSEDRVVGETGLAGESRGDFSDSGCAFLPHDIHETELGFGEVEGFFSRQERLYQLRN